MAKYHSCGVAITDGQRVLAIIPWGRKHSLDLPKGGRDVGEEPVNCALRELREETGIELTAQDVTHLGKFAYTEDKDLELFVHRTKKLPDVSTLRCKSTFTNQYGRTVPEATGFEIVEFSDDRFYSRLKPILFLVQKSLQ